MFIILCSLDNFISWLLKTADNINIFITLVLTCVFISFSLKFIQLFCMVNFLNWKLDYLFLLYLPFPSPSFSSFPSFPSSSLPFLSLLSLPLISLYPFIYLLGIKRKTSNTHFHWACIPNLRCCSYFNLLLKHYLGSKQSSTVLFQMMVNFGFLTWMIF